MNIFVDRLQIAVMALVLVTGTARVLSAIPSAAINTRATLIGDVVEEGTGEPIGFVNILLEEINRSVTSRENGRFVLSDLPPQKMTLKTFRIGYNNISVPLTFAPGDTLEIVLVLETAPIHMGGVAIEKSRNGDAAGIKPALLYSDKKLFQNLGQTIAQTIDYEPGISLRSMGPAPARPVLRGQGGDQTGAVLDAGQGAEVLGRHLLQNTAQEHVPAKLRESCLGWQEEVGQAGEAENADPTGPGQPADLQEEAIGRAIEIARVERNVLDRGVEYPRDAVLVGQLVGSERVSVGLRAAGTG